MYNIYLIYAEFEGLGQWKIGLSKNPERRLNEMRTANPNIKGIHALYEIDNRQVAYKTEALMKRFLKPFQIGGEWVDIIALNQTLFLEYCKKYETHARVLIEIENNKKFKY